MTSTNGSLGCGVTGRAVLAAEVARLRAAGLLYRQIAERLGISRSYASELAADPDGSRGAARKKGYGGVCERCGARTDGSSGRRRAPRLCGSCSRARQRAEKRWTAEAVTDAIRRYADRHGRPPTATEWLRADPANGYPAVTSCYRSSTRSGAPFGSWGEAIEAAGYPRPKPGQAPGQRWWTPELVVSELQRLQHDGTAPAYGADPPLVHAAKRFYGSWAQACAAAELRPRRGCAAHSEREAE